MDLHLIPGAEASAEERGAVDSVAGPAESGWEGGQRRPETEGHLALGGHASRARRHLLLPALWAIQSRIGWISAGALNYVCQRLSVAPADAYGVATFYAMLSVAPQPKTIVHVCDDLACRLAGGPELLESLRGRLPDNALRPSPCLGLCERAPAVLFQCAGDGAKDFVVAPADPAAVESAFEVAAPHPVPLPPGEGNLESPQPLESSQPLQFPPFIEPLSPHQSHQSLLSFQTPQFLPSSLAPRRGERVGVRGEGSPSAPQTQDARRSGLHLLARVGHVDPTSLDDYRSNGGYEALSAALALGPEGVVREALASKLQGRGGAAFPAGRKWEAVSKQQAQPHYLVCNADESEPGTFKDRVLMEEDPFAVVEAMTIVAYATGCEQGYLYVRGEYPTATERIAGAVAAARSAGLLGDDVLGKGFRFDIELRRGAGAYICGEETALFNSIEGFRGEPRNKPPFPVEKGLFGKPTVINNVETLVNVLPIVLEGGDAFAAIGTAQSTGPKLFCLSGSVARPGVYEVPFGPTLRQLIELAGGVPGGRAVRAVLLGGAAGSFVSPEELDVPLTFEGTRAINASLGSGVIMVFDERADLRDAVRRIAAFFRDESCGQCVPCRVGTERQEELVGRLDAGRPLKGRADEDALLDEIARAMKDASICGLGQTASGAIQSAIRKLGVFPA